jgi:hypothetical protein
MQRLLYKLFISFIISVTIISSTLEALANDSTSHMTPTGIAFIKNEDISIESEILFLAERFVEVEYEFYNHSSNEITIQMAFPLSEVDSGVPPPEALNFLVYINGQEYKNVKVHWRALIHGIDKALILQRLGLSVVDSPQCLSQNLTYEDKEILIKEGLVHQLRGNCLSPAWVMQAVFLWEAKFLPQKTTKVKHVYNQMPGYEDRELDGKNHMFTNSKELENASKQFGGSSIIHRYFYEYILHTGGNWKGPIKKFKFKAEGPKDSWSWVDAPFAVKRQSDTTLTAEIENYELSSRTEVVNQLLTKGQFEMNDGIITFNYATKLDRWQTLMPNRGRDGN